MKPIDIIVMLVIFAIVGGAVLYIVKSKKSGKKCIGCSFSSCSSCSACCIKKKHEDEKEREES